jgi:hypothetical protein
LTLWRGCLAEQVRTKSLIFKILYRCEAAVVDSDYDDLSSARHANSCTTRIGVNKAVVPNPLPEIPVLMDWDRVSPADELDLKVVIVINVGSAHGDDEYWS